MDRHRDEEATQETIISYVTMQTAADVEKEREGNRGEEEERSGNKKVERTARPRLKNNHMGRLWNQIITAHIYVFSEATTFSGCRTFMAAEEKVVCVGRRMTSARRELFMSCVKLKVSKVK